MKTAPLPMTLLFDPWAGARDPRHLSAAVKSLMEPSEVPPIAWFQLPTPARVRLGGLGLRAVADHPNADVHRLGALIRHCLRAAYTPADELGMNAQEAEYPVRFFVEDPDERPTWRDAERALAHYEIDALALLRELAEKLRGVDGAAAELLKRRAAIDAQLERLATLRGPAAAEAKARR